MLNADQVQEALRLYLIRKAEFYPVTDGLEVLEKINALLVKRPVAVLLSAVNSPEFEEQLVSAGADYYFIKPADAQVVVKRIDSLVNWQVMLNAII